MDNKRLDVKSHNGLVIETTLELTQARQEDVTLLGRGLLPQQVGPLAEIPLEGRVVDQPKVHAIHHGGVGQDAGVGEFWEASNQ